MHPVNSLWVIERIFWVQLSCHTIHFTYSFIAFLTFNIIIICNNKKNTLSAKTRYNAMKITV